MAAEARPKLGWRSRCADVIASFPAGAEELSTGTTIMTGPTAGIGVETAAALASIGGRVVLAARSPSKSQKTAEDIMKRHPSATLSCLPLDLASLSSVASFVAQYRERAKAEGWKPLKCIVLNAGVIAFSHRTSEEGHELTFAVSHLAHFFLVTELLPELRAAAPSRVVVVSSGSHHGPHATTNVRSDEALRAHLVAPAAEGWGYLRGMKAYGSAKLCNAMMARSIAAKFKADGIDAVSLHPGTMMGTSIARDSPVGEALMKRVLSLFTKSMDQGSSTTLACCLAPHGTLQGRFYADCCLSKHHALLDDDQGAEALWALSEELCAPHLSTVGAGRVGLQGK